MNAKELIEAATYFNDRPTCECDPESGVTNCIGCDVGMMADHILATVRPDDDEPVTRERLEADGWFRWDKEPYVYLYGPSHRFMVLLSLPEEPEGFWLHEPRRLLKSMGHLRRLVAALGE